MELFSIPLYSRNMIWAHFCKCTMQQAASAQLTEYDVIFSPKRFLHIFSGLIGLTIYWPYLASHLRIALKFGEIEVKIWHHHISE